MQTVRTDRDIVDSRTEVDRSYARRRDNREDSVHKMVEDEWVAILASKAPNQDDCQGRTCLNDRHQVSHVRQQVRGPNRGAGRAPAEDKVVAEVGDRKSMARRLLLNNKLSDAR